jgi:hypothetical protein
MPRSSQISLGIIAYVTISRIADVYYLALEYYFL